MNDEMQLLEEIREVVRLTCAASGQPEPVLLDEEIRAALDYTQADRSYTKLHEQRGEVSGDTFEDRAKSADYIELPEDIPGTKCGNCMYITPTGYCKKLRGDVKDKGCCDFWDRAGTKRRGKITEAIIACEPQVPVPDVRQHFGFDCGAAALKSVFDYFGVDPGTEPHIIAELGSSPRDGTSPDKIVHLAVKEGLTVHASGPMTLDELRAYLDLKQPVICPVQMFWHDAKGDDDARVNPDEDENGHWIVVAGMDDRSMCIQDPVYGKVFLKPAEFLRAWHDRDGDGRRYIRWGVALSK
jgi:predicted double-glycine peptidase